jgi:hypothetical protein
MARATRSASTSKPKVKKEDLTPKSRSATKKATPNSTTKAKPAPKSKAQHKSKLRAKPSLSTEPPSPTQSSSEEDDSEDAYGEESTAETEPEDDESAFSAEDTAESDGPDSDNLDEDSEDETPKKGKRKAGFGNKSDGGDAKKVKYDPDGKNTREVEQLVKVPGPKTDRECYPVAQLQSDCMPTLSSTLSLQPKPRLSSPPHSTSFAN